MPSIREFPSPCGVVGMNPRINRSYRLAKLPVSVPLRGSGYESRAIIQRQRQPPHLFPSPCGVVGMNQAGMITPFETELIVSVPLRGSGYESRADAEQRLGVKCFRPLAG